MDQTQPVNKFARIALKAKGPSSKCVQWWKTTLRWYRLLQPARACLLASLLVPVIFVWVEQGRDTLRRIASEGVVSAHAIWMHGGASVVGLVSWAWARFLLDC